MTRPAPRKETVVRVPTLLLVTGLLTGCFGNPERPAPPSFPAADAFSRPLPTSESFVATGDWWQRAIDDELSGQVTDALARNPELASARSDIDAARAELAQANSRRGPAVILGADATVRDASGSAATDSASASLDGTVPIDISGALARREDIAAALLLATEEDAQQLISDLALEFVTASIDMAEAGERQALLDRQIDASQTLLRLIELRFTQGLSSSVDVLQQRDELASLRQQLPSARLDLDRARNTLRRVANLPPPAPVPAAWGGLPEIKPVFAATIPIALLTRRADLRASQARLIAADAAFAAAIADRLPTLDLSAGAVALLASGDITSVIRAALDASLTLFDSGEKRAIVDEQRARLEAAGHDYVADWLQLVIEADNLIAEESSLRERIGLSTLRLETAEDLLTAAQRRYERGVSDYLPVLAALRGLQQQQRDHLSLRAALGRSRAELHHALGDEPAAQQTGGNS